MTHYPPSPDIEPPPAPEPPRYDDHLRTQATDARTWLRLLYMIIFAVIFYAVFFITCFIGLFNFVARLFTGHSNTGLNDFSATLADYARELVLFITGHSEKKPYPFKE